MTHQPKGSMCISCGNANASCASRPFASMPVIKTYPDGVKAVKCTGHVHAQASTEKNAALQQVYDATQLEIDHLRGATKSKLLAQPVAWMVYLPSIDTQHLYYSQEDMGYVDDVTNHADAEVTPLYEMAPPKAEVAPAGEYPAITAEFINKHVHPSQAAKLCRADWSGKDESSVETVHPEVIKLLHAYVDADRAMRAQAAHAAVAGPSETVKFVDESTADPVEKARRYLKAMGDPRMNSAYFFDDGYPRREISQGALATLAVLEQLAAAPATQPAPAAQGEVPMYRLLQSGVDRIEAADEFLSDDATTWAIDPNGIFVGNIYGGHVLRPARRRIKGGQHGIE